MEIWSMRCMENPATLTHTLLSGWMWNAEKQQKKTMSRQIISMYIFYVRRDWKCKIGIMFHAFDRPKGKKRGSQK